MIAEPKLMAPIQKKELSVKLRSAQKKKNKNEIKFTRTYFRITINYDINSGSAAFMLCSYVTNEVFIDLHTGGCETL